MDRITKSYLNVFQAEQSLPDMSESDLFEHFASFCAVSDCYDEEFDIADVVIGEEDDLGIDGIAIIVNGIIATSVDEANDLIGASPILDVGFIFTQAKTTSGFSAEQIMTFLDGVEEFFEEVPSLAMSPELVAAHEIMTAIYSYSIKFRRQKPTCRMFYVTTGTWANDAHILGKVSKRLQRLRDSGLFSEVEFVPMGANELHESYQRSKNSVTAEFTFSNKVTLPDIQGVDEAYLGILPVSEFLPLITDHAGGIRKSLFYDNIRDFQGYGAVNDEIRTTLQDGGAQQRFPILNNGVTVVARGLRATGNKFVVSDYQIVNGCQTSHVLFDESGNLKSDLHVPLRLIATTDDDIINSVITATNRQTQVTTEDLYALSSFQKRLEALFESYPDKKKLHYERRSKQYNAVSGIEKVRIITKPQQIRAFAAMFNDEPHRASRYYSDLRSAVGRSIFNEQHKLDPYYTSAFAYYKLEFFFRNGSLPVYYKPARYQLLMAFKYIVAGKEVPALTANKVEGYCNKICETLWSDSAALKSFRQSIEIVDAVIEGPLTRDSVKVQAFTDAVKSKLGVGGVRLVKDHPRSA
ncbi:AIPR family protein [Micromonospora sp. NPDC005413]|uniref:AIPR family protein n=1 Tax=Micromonospora sp. NPDC005413 TaxID=3154563 RepID=UPI0033AD21CD